MEELRQANIADLRTNFLLARKHQRAFEREVCEPINAALRRDESPSQPGPAQASVMSLPAAQELLATVGEPRICEDFQQIRSVLRALEGRAASEEYGGLDGLFEEEQSDFMVSVFRFRESVFRTLRLNFRCFWPREVQTETWLEELKDLSGSTLPVQLETKEPLFMEASGKLDFSLRIHLRGLEVPGPVMLRLGLTKHAAGGCLHVAAGALERPLLPVLSPPFLLRPAAPGRGDDGGSDLPDPARLSLEQCRLVEVPGCGLAECRGDLGIGGGVWDGGLVLLEYLAHPAQRPRLEGRRVLELGSGTGLVGLGCALLGAQVLLTDLPDVTSLLDWPDMKQKDFNVALNRARRSGLERVQVQAHEWGTDVAALEPAALEVVIMADLIYDVEPSKQLILNLSAPIVSIATLAAANPSICFLLAFRPRNIEDPDFFRELSGHFRIDQAEDFGGELRVRVYEAALHELQVQMGEVHSIIEGSGLLGKELCYLQPVVEITSLA
ncbi:Protein N-lysine methyltransferase METTL21A [Symbiodinium microadriaticum]|uniref:Protein N-lysine methyltransferase METTL21A n=1 Tax=Symbiodinium microadriaticum TaxID=2951 RepID=A0A1Q9F5T8_SYMMI|nr:Protein N-lysine methyltransferase METTL21A [Symbiodinium microadriaticum]